MCSNTFVSLCGYFLPTKKLYQKQNKSLSQAIGVYDVNNMFRVLEDIYGVRQDYLFLFDEDFFSICEMINCKDVPEFIKEYEAKHPAKSKTNNKIRFK